MSVCVYSEGGYVIDALNVKRAVIKSGMLLVTELGISKNPVVVRISD